MGGVKVRVTIVVRFVRCSKNPSQNLKGTVRKQYLRRSWTSQMSKPDLDPIHPNDEDSAIVRWALSQAESDGGVHFWGLEWGAHIIDIWHNAFSDSPT